MSDDTTEADLVRAAALGDDRSFAILFERYRPLVRYICGRSAECGEDVDDAVQETFIKAYRALPSVTCVNLGAWVAQIARHVCIDRARRDKRGPACVEFIELRAAQVADGPEQVMTLGDSRLDDSMARLSDDHRVAIALRYVEECSHVEIAALMHKSPAQVKALIHRAKLRLQAAWIATA